MTANILFPDRSKLTTEEYQHMVSEYGASFGNPSTALLQFGKVKDGKAQKIVHYDPWRMTNELQQTIIDYWSNTPRGQYGETLYLTSLKYRQGGSTNTSVSCAYVTTQYRPEWRHITMTDKTPRSRQVHDRVNLLDRNWPDAIRVPKQKGRGQEMYSTHFDPNWGGHMVIQSAGSVAEGIGDSPDSMVLSECGFWPNFNKAMGLIGPALGNREDGLVHYECTPVPKDAPSAEAWKNHCISAKQGLGRHVYHFAPYWDGLFNRRLWRDDYKLTVEEMRYLDKYEHLGLTKENLSFRRYMMDTFQEFQDNPDLWDVFYPCDDVHCWGRSAKGVIHPTHLRYMISRYHDKMVEWPDARRDSISAFDDFLDPKEPADAPLGEVKVYRPYNPNAVYVFCCDPAGYGVRDEAAWHIFEVWKGEIEQAVTYASRRSQPDEVVVVAMRWLKRYGLPYAVVERNGVGAAILTGLKLLGYDQDKVYHTGKWPDDRPGWQSNEYSNQEALGYLIQLLREQAIIINDRATYSQLLDYKNDKSIEHGLTAELKRRIKGDDPNPGRRARHHWDRVSALVLLAVAVCEGMVPLRRRPSEKATEELDKSDWDEKGIPYEHIEAVAKLQAKDRAALAAPKKDDRFPTYVYGTHRE